VWLRLGNFLQGTFWPGWGIKGTQGLVGGKNEGPEVIDAIRHGRLLLSPSSESGHEFLFREAFKEPPSE